MRGMRNACSILVGKPERKRALGRRRHRWKENIGMDLKEIVWEGVVWMQLTQDGDPWPALANTVMSLPVT
jgi:hypothetical protein